MHDANRSATLPLRGHRLGQGMRRLLLRAVKSQCTVQISEGARSDIERYNRRRAARKLEQLGLVRLDLIQVPHPEGRLDFRPRLLMELTDLGWQVADTFRRELECGRRVRWARLDRRLALTDQ